MHEADDALILNQEHLVMLLAEPISHASTPYMDSVEIFNIWLDLSTIYLIILVGVELPLCTLCIVVTLS